jgi:hypothetical protein
MGAELAITAVTLLLENLPAVVDTGEKVFAFVTKGISSISEAVGDKDVTNEELVALVQKIASQHEAIQAID